MDSVPCRSQLRGTPCCKKDFTGRLGWDFLVFYSFMVVQSRTLLISPPLFFSRLIRRDHVIPVDSVVTEPRGYCRLMLGACCFQPVLCNLTLICICAIKIEDSWFITSAIGISNQHYKSTPEK